MKKRIVICADGTWNRPEKKLGEDHPTNVLRMARAIRPIAADGHSQQVFYDWGIGSYYDPVVGGATGKGINKNIMDDYRYIVQNYSPGDEIYLFGFSRGAYTVRSLCGLINNCGILTRPDAGRIQQAFDHYKRRGKKYAPDGEKSLEFRDKWSHPSRNVHFVGVWDTVGALGIPFSFLGLLDRQDEFHDTKIGPNVRMARHALAIDEQRSDFEPTIWRPRPGLDLKQVWFVGAHSDVGGSHVPDKSGRLLSDIPLGWLMKESGLAGLELEPHLSQSLRPDPLARLHPSRKHVYRSKKAVFRPLAPGGSETLVHASVRDRWEADPGYRPRNLVDLVDKRGWTMLEGSPGQV